MPTLSTRAICRGIRAGQTRAIARAISLIESRSPGASTILTALHARIGTAHRIGITGAPGVGKSTLIARLAPQLQRPGRSLAILAVDPTSPVTGGAFLGDRVRMHALVNDPRIFIRSMATRGATTGLAPSTARAVDLLDAARFDPILIETVGAGQVEGAITRVARTVVLILAPGLGDLMQCLKAGLMELAHVIVVNKADHRGAAAMVHDLRRVHRCTAGRGWTVPIVTTIAERGTGVDELTRHIQRHRAWLTAAR